MKVEMLIDITTDDTCKKGDIVYARYLYDGKYQLLTKVGSDKEIGYQCYDYQIKPYNANKSK